MTNGELEREARLLADIRRMARLLGDEPMPRPSAEDRLVILLGEAQARRALARARRARPREDARHAADVSRAA